MTSMWLPIAFFDICFMCCYILFNLDGLVVIFNTISTFGALWKVMFGVNCYLPAGSLVGCTDVRPKGYWNLYVWIFYIFMFNFMFLFKKREKKKIVVFIWTISLEGSQLQTCIWIFSFKPPKTCIIYVTIFPQLCRYCPF